VAKGKTLIQVRVAQSFYSDPKYFKYFFSKYFNSGKGLRLDRLKRTLALSWLIKKDSHLFQGNKNGAPDFVLLYLEKDIRDWLKTNVVSVDYLKHDWTLNDLAKVD